MHIDLRSDWGASEMRYTTQVPFLVSRQFDNEVILANLQTGVYYSLAGPAADVWLGLRAGASSEEIVIALAAMSNHSPDATRAWVENFVTRLENEQIILPHDGAAVDTSWKPQFSVTMSEPLLERFDDLRDLLLLDPVHDVDDAGWPVKAKDAV
jgi:hypothetical protein